VGAWGCRAGGASNVGTSGGEPGCDSGGGAGRHGVSGGGGGGCDAARAETGGLRESNKSTVACWHLRVRVRQCVCVCVRACVRVLVCVRW
jgi:hypothetical protein